MGNYAGVDWASEKHDVLICDEAGEELLAATFVHDEAGLGGLCRALERANVELVAVERPDGVLVERPDGVLVERLLDAGLRVLALHPNQVAAARPRFRASGGKSDRFDAFVLCELARTDHHRFRVLEPDTDETKALRALTWWQTRTEPAPPLQTAHTPRDHDRQPDRRHRTPPDVHLGNGVDHKPREMIGRQPLPHIRRK
jgi:Transposase